MLKAKIVFLQTDMQVMTTSDFRTGYWSIHNSKTQLSRFHFVTTTPISNNCRCVPVCVQVSLAIRRGYVPDKASTAKYQILYFWPIILKIS